MKHADGHTRSSHYACILTLIFHFLSCYINIIIFLHAVFGGTFPAGKQLVYKDPPVAVGLITAFNMGHSFLVLATPCVHLGVIRS
jgi:hypothetical protein